MTRAVHWLSPGDPAARTGGSLYNAAMVRGLRARGRSVVVHQLDGAWPVPADPPGLPALPTGALVVADGLLLTGMAGRLTARPDLRVVALVHSPLWREAADREALRAREAQVLAGCSAVVATSRSTADEVSADARRDVVVVEPGTTPAALAPPASAGALLCPAHLIARKGHDTLLTALGRLTDRSWSLVLAGDGQAEPATAAAVAAQAAALGGRVRLVGLLDASGMEAAWAAASLVVLPSRYEAFGMVLAEAVARGRPVLCAPAGAVPLLGDAARVVPAGDVDAWATALSAWLDDAGTRAGARAAAVRVRPTLPDEDAQAARFAAVLDGVA